MGYSKEMTVYDVVLEASDGTVQIIKTEVTLTVAKEETKKLNDQIFSSRMEGCRAYYVSTPNTMRQFKLIK